MAGSVGVVVGSPCVEGVDVVVGGASIVLAAAVVERVPRVEETGHANPAELASRLFSMVETVNQRKV